VLLFIENIMFFPALKLELENIFEFFFPLHDRFLFSCFMAQPEQWQMKCKLVVGAESTRMYLTPRQRHKLEMNSLEVCVLNHFE